MRSDAPIDVSSIEGLQGALLREGKATDIIAGAQGAIVKGDMCGNCQDPIEVYRSGFTTGWSGYAKLDRVAGSEDRLRRAVAVRLRCRKCSSCLQARSRYWRNAATREMAQAVFAGGRTWFGTLTLAPDKHAEALYRAYARVGGIGAFGELSPEAQFAARHQAIQRSLTLALKRLRKELGAGAFRYLLVCEAHTGGGESHMLPHYHMLLHECSAGLPIRKSSLNDFWPLGFSQWRLADPSAARYVAKYLSKAASARVRASQHYGSVIHKTTFVPAGGTTA